MRIHFLAHSGFVLETEAAILIFDYYQDPAGVLDRVIRLQKPCLFLVSHIHQDHWNPLILDYGRRMAVGCRYILEEDVAKSPKVKADLAPDAYLTAKAGSRLAADQIQVPGIEAIYCYRSNDEGVAFLLETTEGLIYHAGDLNDWNWGDRDAPYYERTYREELAKLKADLGGRKLELAMLPVDHRLGEKALSGAHIFTSLVGVDLLVPMHLNGDPDLPRALAESMQVNCYSGEAVQGRSSAEAGLIYQGHLVEQGQDVQPVVLSLTRPGESMTWTSQKPCSSGS